MGTSIELVIEHVSLSYSKNSMGMDYGYLFQKEDLVRRRSDQLDYDYFKDNGDDEEVAQHEEGFARPLSGILRRLELSGYSLDAARYEYEAVISDEAEIDDSVESASKFLSFDEFCKLACRYPLKGLSNEYIEYDSVDRDRLSQGRFALNIELFDKLPFSNGLYWSEASYVSARLCILSAESMLQVFGLNPQNLDAEVVWQFGPIVTSGWVKRDLFQAGATRRQALLVATEGASDARILRHALDILRPEVADFFRFIDGNERHHFWGTGNLVKFAEGLLRIDVHNLVLFLFDNDAEGVDAYRKMLELNLPANMRSMVLPDLNDLRAFPALGPEGVQICDINGRAAAIECYLDLRVPGYPSARVVWSNYKRDIDAWHGALEYKESYTKHFMAQEAASLTNGEYDVSKLSTLLEALIAEASALIGPLRLALDVE